MAPRARKPSPLRAVARGDVPAPPKTVTQAAAHGSTRELLVAMRDRVATAVEDPATPPRDLGTLTKRLMDIARELETLDAADEEAGARGSVPDERFDASAV